MTGSPAESAQSGALPFTVNQSHAIDSMDIGTVATKVSATAITIDQPSTGIAEHPVVESDVLTHLPVGAKVSVMEGAGPTGKQIAVTLPAAADGDKPFTVICASLHETMAKAWTWIKKEAAEAESAL